MKQLLLAVALLATVAATPANACVDSISCAIQAMDRDAEIKSIKDQMMAIDRLNVEDQRQADDRLTQHRELNIYLDSIARAQLHQRMVK